MRISARIPLQRAGHRAKRAQRTLDRFAFRRDLRLGFANQSRDVRAADALPFANDAVFIVIDIERLSGHQFLTGGGRVWRSGAASREECNCGYGEMIAEVPERHHDRNSLRA